MNSMSLVEKIMASTFYTAFFLTWLFMDIRFRRIEKKIEDQEAQIKDLIEAQKAKDRTTYL